MIKSIFLTIAIWSLFVFNTQAQTYIREYTYKASEADSKLSARAIALQEVKRELLNELGTHVKSLIKINASSDGSKLGTEEIETLSAGVTHVEILNEKWNGETYVLKAQIKANPEDVLKSLHKMIDANQKQKQIIRLDGDLSKLRKQNINISAAYTHAKKETTAALTEIARLKNELDRKQTEIDKRVLKEKYQQQIDTLTLNEFLESGLEHYQKGDYIAAFSLFMKVSDQGNAYAQFYLGLMYANGNGVARNLRKAVYWYQKAADRGEVNPFDQFDDGVSNARVNLGLMYAEGEGVDQDPKQAIYWWQKAAELGYADAQYYLGHIYDYAKDNIHDSKLAVYWYQKAAAQDVSKAQYQLGIKYANGDEVIHDTKQAMYWYIKSAMSGDDRAQYQLGMIYTNGIVAPNYDDSFLFKVTSVGDFDDSSFFVKYPGGVNKDTEPDYYLLKNKGIIRDQELALYWLGRAAWQGNKKAQLELKNR